jgi:hypothetical protein
MQGGLGNAVTATKRAEVFKEREGATVNEFDE